MSWRWQAIARLEDDRSLARGLGEAARAKALAEYDERRIVARTLDVYHELLGEPPTGANLLQNDGRRPQVIVERIDAMVTTTGTPVKIATATPLLLQNLESSKGETSTPSFQ